jgi:heme-binding protein
MLLWLKRLGIPLLLALLVIQLFQPAKTNPPIDPQREVHAFVPADPAASAVIQRSCNDCHSHLTVWPWYSHVAPVSWLVVSDVNRGRHAMNLSEWATYRPEEQQKRLTEICKEVSEGEMPGFSYTLMHKNAKLSQSDIATVCRWAQSSTRSAESIEKE